MPELRVTRADGAEERGTAGAWRSSEPGWLSPSTGRFSARLPLLFPESAVVDASLILAGQTDRFMDRSYPNCVLDTNGLLRGSLGTRSMGVKRLSSPSFSTKIARFLSSASTESEFEESCCVFPRDLTENLGRCRFFQQSQGGAGDALPVLSGGFGVIALGDARAMAVGATAIAAKNQLTAVASDEIASKSGSRDEGVVCGVRGHIRVEIREVGEPPVSQSAWFDGSGWIAAIGRDSALMCAQKRSACPTKIVFG